MTHSSERKRGAAKQNGNKVKGGEFYGVRSKRVKMLNEEFSSGVEVRGDVVGVGG